MATEKDILRKNAEFAIELSDSLKRLEQNADFNKVFNFYFNHEPIRLTHLLAIFEEKPGELQAVKDSLIGIARCSAFLRSVHAIAEMQRKTLEDLDKEENQTATPVDAEIV